MKKKVQHSPQLQKLHSFTSEIKERFKQTHAHAHGWLAQKALDVGQLRHRSQDILAVASLAGTLALRGSVDAQAVNQVASQTDDKSKKVLASITQDEYTSLIEKMNSFVGMRVGHIEKQQEMYL